MSLQHLHLTVFKRQLRTFSFDNSLFVTIYFNIGQCPRSYFAYSTLICIHVLIIIIIIIITTINIFKRERGVFPLLLSSFRPFLFSTQIQLGVRGGGLMSPENASCKVGSGVHSCRQERSNNKSCYNSRTDPFAWEPNHVP